MIAPPITDALIAYLNHAVPELSPKLGESQEELMWRGGQRDIVNHLISVKKHQEEPEVTGDDEEPSIL